MWSGIVKGVKGGVHQRWRLMVIVGTFVVYLGTLGVTIYYSFVDTGSGPGFRGGMMGGGDMGFGGGMPDFGGNGTSGFPPMATDPPINPPIDQGDVINVGDNPFATTDDDDQMGGDGPIAGPPGGFVFIKVMPASWVFSVIWGGIYVYNAIWMLYALTLIFRKSGPTSFLYYDPAFIPVATYLCFAVQSILGAVWLYIASAGLLWENTLVIFIMWVFAVASLVTAVRGLDRCARKFLKSINKGKDIVFTIGLVHNALAMYLTWLSVATLVSLTTTLVYQFRLDADIACYIALGVLALFLVIWVAAENIAAYEKLKYVFTPYVVFIVAVVAIFLNNVERGLIFDPVNIFVIVHLSLGSIALCLKLIVICSRETNSSGDVIMYSKQGAGAKAAKPNKSILKRSNSASMQQDMVMTNLGFQTASEAMAAAPAYHQQSAQPAQMMVQQPQQVLLPQAQPQQQMMMAQPQQQPPTYVQEQTQPMMIQQPQQQTVMQQAQPQMMIQQPQPQMMIQQPQPQMMIQQPQPQVFVTQQPRMIVTQAPQPMLSSSGPVLLERGSGGTYSPLKQVVRPQVNMRGNSTYDYIYV